MIPGQPMPMGMPPQMPQPGIPPPGAAPGMPPPVMGAMPPMGGAPGAAPLMGLFGLLSSLAGKKERTTPMDDMRSAIKQLQKIYDLDPEKTGKNVPMAIDILRNGPDSFSSGMRSDGKF